jgi:hypothetical protein
MDKIPDAITKANLIGGEEFVRQQPALAAVLAGMAVRAVRRHARQDEPGGGSTNVEKDPTASTPAELAALRLAGND